MAFRSLLAAPFTSNDAARMHEPVGRTRSTGTLRMKVDDVPPPSGPTSPPTVPELTERVFRSALCALQAAHAILATARPDLRRARVEIFAAAGNLVGWFAATDLERCSLSIRDVVTDKQIVFPAPLTGPDTKPPGDDPMLRSQPKIPAPTGTQLAEIAELVRWLSLSDAELGLILRRCGVAGGVAAIGEHWVAARVLGILYALRRKDGLNGRTLSADAALYTDAVGVVLKAGRGSATLLQYTLGIGYGRASRLILKLEDAGIVGKRRGPNPRRVLITAAQWKARAGRSEG